MMQTILCLVANNGDTLGKTFQTENGCLIRRPVVSFERRALSMSCWENEPVRCELRLSHPNGGKIITNRALKSDLISILSRIRFC